MKRYNKIMITICTSLFIWGCTSDFEEVNTNPEGFSNEQLTQDFNHVKELLPPMLYSIYPFSLTSSLGSYQLQGSLIADVYSGYMGIPTPYRGNNNNTHYSLVDGWNQEPWTIAYGFNMSNFLKLEERSEDNVTLAPFLALGRIARVEAMHRVSDIYGPIIFSRYGSSDTATPFDSQKDVYYQFFAELDLAVNDLTKAINSEQPEIVGSADVSKYAGSYRAWIKFANSLRLRLAMRIVNADGDKARSEAETAMANEFGVIESPSENFIVTNTASVHPVEILSSGTNDVRMGASIESIMVGYKDPRLSRYFDFSTFPGLEDTYKGMRSGINIDDKNDYLPFSLIGDVVEDTHDALLMTAAEVYFLRAEGALRGWAGMGGTAQFLYETGIRSSFEQHGLAGAEEYIADESSKPINYIDPANKGYNIEAVSTATIKWDESAEPEVKLEKIITQKWIACFPESNEPWAEFRRTGYPKLFPVAENKSRGEISTKEFIRRINFPITEKNGNPQGVADAVKLLGGGRPDTGGTRLWWDVPGSNF
ncbi:SusD/RagB family nutrient-binding outer membrane lipoprotein [Leptobacterium flavescens]|uniref:SusD/RagB family nutrient-binding outer membrane lipoprotein n=1 Tax=Leptobacterium flavescens TaxID=472055 RepID=A0A6P0UTM4_9FLAO|nr:RagB/SusD family nutrient uptake outer membrane protein [Leptobacterium flavescens]NER13776.1 SusD/RagB family nutrient-binding outer membrane lipoprotein [Leptobacterium flavescens]